MTIDLSLTTAGAITTILVAVISALAGAVSKILREIRSAKAEVKSEVVANAVVGQIAGDARDKKLDQITILVDGRYSDVLLQLASVLQVVATGTGNPVDQRKADVARLASEAQEDRVRQSQTPTKAAELIPDRGPQP